MNRLGLVAALVLGAMVQALFAPVLTLNFSWGAVEPRLVVLPLIAMMLYSPLVVWCWSQPRLRGC